MFAGVSRGGGSLLQSHQWTSLLPVRTSPGVTLFAFADHWLFGAVKTQTQGVIQESMGPCHSALDLATQHSSIATHPSPASTWLSVFIPDGAMSRIVGNSEFTPQLLRLSLFILTQPEAQNNNIMIHRPCFLASNHFPIVGDDLCWERGKECWFAF